MTPQEPNRRQLGIYFAIAQVGMEMVVPVVLGLWLDNTLEWRPWGVIVGAVLGLAFGLIHLAVLSQRSDKTDKP